MFILQFLLTFYLLMSSVNCDCERFTCLSYLANKNVETCWSNGSYFRGLISNVETAEDDTKVFSLVGAKCCRPPAFWDIPERVVEYVDWTEALAGGHNWVLCPSGYFLAGLGTYGTWDLPIWDFAHVGGGKCMKPAEHPHYYKDCYEVDTANCLTSNKICTCNNGYYITGLYKSSGNEIVYLNKLKCCSMVTSVPEIQNFEDLKTRIMEKTFQHLSLLTEGLGFSMCSGGRGVKCNRDFVRVGNIWESTSGMKKSKHCRGPKCDERVRIFYDNWNLEVVSVNCDKTLVDRLKPEIIYQGTVKNDADSKVTETIDISRILQETLTHTVHNKFPACPEVELVLNFEIQLISGSPVQYSTKVVLSDSNITQASTLRTTLLQRKNAINLQPNSSAGYKVTLNKVKRTISYTAVVAVKFSTELSGFLKPLTNYHFEHKGKIRPVHFMYRFGDKSTSFYRALKRETEYKSMPWLWNEMLKNVNGSRTAVDRLLHHGNYEFQIQGTLEIVSEVQIDIVWEKVRNDNKDSNL